MEPSPTKIQPTSPQTPSEANFREAKPAQQHRGAAPFSLIAVLMVSLLLGATTGCGTFKIPVFQRPTGSGPYVPVGPGVQMSGGESLELYQKLKQAKRENAVVLEVVDDDVPVRVLPLPPGQTSVFVSQLLKQTGVQAKLGSIEATLYRYSTDTVSGIPMKVRMDDDGEVVRPESDYALRSGDRLQVSEKEFNVLSSLGDLLGA